MERLPMCRVCLVEDVRMIGVVNKDLHELYEKLTDVPFVTESCRPTLVCYFCYTKLKQCYQFLRICLQAAEFFAQMLDEDYEPNPLIRVEHFQCFSGYSKTPVVHIDIYGCQAKSVAETRDLAVVCETQDDIFKPEERNQIDGTTVLKKPKLATRRDVTTKDNAAKAVINSIEPSTNAEAGVTNSITNTDINTDNINTGTTVLRKTKLATRRDVTTKDNAAKAVINSIEPSTNAEAGVTNSITNTDINTDNINTGTTVLKKPKLATRRDVTTKDNAAKAVINSIEPSTNAEAGVTNSITNTDINTDNINTGTTVLKKPKLATRRDVTTKDNAAKAVINSIEPSTNAEAGVTNSITNTDINTDNINTGTTVLKKPKLASRRDVTTKDNAAKAVINSIEPSTNAEAGVTNSITNTDINTDNITKDHLKFQKPFTCNIICHNGKNLYKCKLCPRIFYKKSLLTRHSLKHKDEQPYICDYCKREFRYKNVMIKHMRQHTEKRNECKICQRCFKQKSELTKHMRIHTSEKPYECITCQRCFAQKITLIRHIRTHTGEKPYKCEICQRSFSHKDNLKKHIRTHSNERPYKCETCQRCFKQKCELTRHMNNIHTVIKPYECETCQRCFAQKITLTRHIRTHTGEKPYKCDICRRNFSMRGNLNKHMRIHTGDRPYQCETCQRSFYDKSAVTRHKRIHSAEER